MFANLVKSFILRSQVRYSYELTRQLCSLKENIAERQAVKEEDEALRIEASLFDQSAHKHQPVTAEEVLKKNRRQKPDKKPENNIPNKVKPAQPFVKKTRVEREAGSRVINDQELGLEYIRLGLNDPRLTTLLITARSKKRRDKDRQIIVEGRRLIVEALQCGLKLDAIIFSEKEQLANVRDHMTGSLNDISHSVIYKVPQHDLKTWSTLTTPPGIMGIFERPSLQTVMERLSTDSTQPFPVTVVCDNIREPNNLGSIIRTCAALPCFQIVITKGCCDPWESKALRGGCGGHFRVPIRDDVDWQDVVLTIPPEAADDCYIFIAENNLKKLPDGAKVIVYSEVERMGTHNVVVIGGETHGVSAEAYKFMRTVGSKGKCLTIPLANGVDSLNAASALTLILYELRRSQLQLQKETTTI